MSWKGIVGKSFTPDEFDAYCHTLKWTTWRPTFIVLHNTAAPSLAQRPQGLTRQHIANLEGFYRDTQHWSAGPHLFIDDKQIWVFTPLTTSGVHSPSWNSVALGIEMLGDFDKESFINGRGLAVCNNAVAAMASLSSVLGINPSTMRLHKEDKKTTHACPGKNVSKPAVIKAVQGLMAKRQGDHRAAPVTLAAMPFADEPMDENAVTPEPEKLAPPASTSVVTARSVAGTGAAALATGQVVASAVGGAGDVAEKATEIVDKSGHIIEATKQVVTVPKPGFWYGVLHVITSPEFVVGVVVLIAAAWTLVWFLQRNHKPPERV